MKTTKNLLVGVLVLVLALPVFAKADDALPLTNARW